MTHYHTGDSSQYELLVRFEGLIAINIRLWSAGMQCHVVW